MESSSAERKLHRMLHARCLGEGPAPDRGRVGGGHGPSSGPPVASTRRLPTRVVGKLELTLADEQEALAAGDWLNA